MLLILCKVNLSISLSQGGQKCQFIKDIFVMSGGLSILGGGYQWSLKDTHVHKIPISVLSTLFKFCIDWLIALMWSLSWITQLSIRAISQGQISTADDVPVRKRNKCIFICIDSFFYTNLLVLVLNKKIAVRNNCGFCQGDTIQNSYFYKLVDIGCVGKWNRRSEFKFRTNLLHSFSERHKSISSLIDYGLNSRVDKAF